MEDLDVNPLYRAFSTNFRREFGFACERSYVIAIPHSDCLEDVVIDQNFANSHILMPSKLLKMHYSPVQVGFCDDFEIEGKKLICYLGKQLSQTKIVVNILAEEIGYNVRQKEFKTILIDRVLVNLNNKNSNDANKAVISNLFAPLTQANFSLRRTSQSSIIFKPAKSLRSHDDCASFLESLSQDLTCQLELDVKRLQSNYMILSGYLEDASERIRSLAELCIGRFESFCLNLARRRQPATMTTVCDSTKRAIRVSVDTYIVHLLHGKLIASLHDLHGRDDAKLMKNFKKIYESRLTICQLGAQQAFEDFVPSDDLMQVLAQLPFEQTPLAIVSCLMKLVELINEALDNSVKFKYLLGGSGGINGHRSIDDRVSICSDDLIATLVYSLARARPPHLYSLSKYLEIFGYSSTDRDQAAYYTATFLLVVQYIYNYDDSNESISSNKNNKHVHCDTLNLGEDEINATTTMVTETTSTNATTSCSNTQISKLIESTGSDIDSMRSVDSEFTDSLCS